jgi:hypothetical protein
MGETLGVNSFTTNHKVYDIIKIHFKVIYDHPILVFPGMDHAPYSSSQMN